jgi:ribonuclease P protein component
MLQTFTRKNRIKKNSEFKEMFKLGKAASSNSVKVFIATGATDTKALGITISKQIKGNVKKNRYKRLVREFFRRHQDQLKPRIRLLVYIKNEQLPARYDMVASVLKRLLVKEKAMNEQ